MNREVFVPPQVASLEPFVRAGVLGPTEVNVVCTFANVAPQESPEVLLAAALAVRAPLHGSICVELQTVRERVVSSIESTAQVSTTQAEGESSSGSRHTTEIVADDDGGDVPVVPDLASLPWPDADQWLGLVASSPLVRVIDGAGFESGTIDPSSEPLRPLVLERGRLYLARYWSLERYVAADLSERSRAASDADGHGGGGPTGGARADLVAAADAEIRRVFDEAATLDGTEVDRTQLAAALAAVETDFVVISGGPGTGKTTTVARLLAGIVGAMVDSGQMRRIALVAPTGKASARMTEAIRGAVGALGDALSAEVVAHLGAIEATTVHRLLGGGRGSGFRHGHENPIPHDIVIVDEVSMVSLSLMAHLLVAVRPGAKVVLVGDPYQLASVEAGSVLGDVVGVGMGATANADPEPPASIRASVRTLGRVHRQGAESGILELATAIRDGRADDALALLRSEHGDDSDVVWIDPGNSAHQPRRDGLESTLLATAGRAVDAARDGDIDAALASINEVKVLCALRRGTEGVEWWNQRIESRLRAEGRIRPSASYSGRPVMVIENDYINGVFNGDVGVAVRSGARYQVWFERAEGNKMVEEVRLDRSVTQWAMSIHKSQGSEFPHAVVALPPPPSRILTRELLYTAVTRAKGRVTLVASEASVRAAIGRQIARASGLYGRLESEGGVR